ncbi:MAG: restriction endonuclease subunit S [Calditrichaceae bacterium]|nr:restriction endonuclease subunit S [Calditrichia bacterium]NUQ43868.1 restriction endonuclease subunit S [Calditrichaceae bacterium]
MNNTWPQVPLGDVIIERNQTLSAEEIAAGKIKIISKIGFNTGKIEFRPDHETRTKMIAIYPGDLVLSGINAAKGAIAIYNETEKFLAAATIHYGSYQVIKEKADIRFLWWLLRSNFFREILFKNLPGGIKTELKARRLLPIKIPLPPLAEQQRIVKKIGWLMGKIEEVRGLQVSNLNKSTVFILSFHFGLAQDRKVKMGEIFKLDELRIPVEAAKEYPQVGIKSFGGGLFSKLSIPGTATSYNYFNHLKAGMLVLSQVKGWEGAVAICPNELDGYFASPEYRTFSCKPEKCLPEYIRNIVITSWFAKKLQAATHGVGGRRERVRPEKFLEIEIPMPIVQKQYEAIKIFQSLNEISSIRLKIEKEIEALLPSILDKAFKGEL